MYASLADLEKQVPPDKLVQLTNDGGGEDVWQGAIDKAISDASAEIDAYAAAQYKVPFQYVPIIIKKLCADIAIYNLFSRRGFDSSKESQDNIILERYKAAIDFLKKLSEGAVKVDTGGPGSGSTAGRETAAKIKNEPRIFKRSQMKGY